MLILDPANIPYYKRRQGLRFGFQRLELFCKTGCARFVLVCATDQPTWVEPHFFEEGRAGVEEQCILQWPTENDFRGRDAVIRIWTVSKLQDRPNEGVGAEFPIMRHMVLKQLFH